MGITIISGDVEDPKQGSKNLKSKVVSSYKKREQDIDKKYAYRGSAGKTKSEKQKRHLNIPTQKQEKLCLKL